MLRVRLRPGYRSLPLRHPRLLKLVRFILACDACWRSGDFSAGAGVGVWTAWERPDGRNAPNGSLTCRVTALPLTLKLVVSFGGAGSIVGTETVANRQVVA